MRCLEAVRTGLEDYISEGKLVVFPTETVYGLGANALNSQAVEQVYHAKNRPPSNPLIVHLRELADASRVASEISPHAHLLMDAFFPGPLTIILPRHRSLPDIVSGGLDTVAIRMPASSIAIEFLWAAKFPVAAPSANLSGRPSATSWQSAAEDLNQRVHCILYGPAATIGLESTVVDCTENPPVLLRPGAISLESLACVVGTISTNVLNKNRSPGMRYHHYAPHAKIVLVSDTSNLDVLPRSAYIGISTPNHASKWMKCFVATSIEEYCHHLFEFFRECDRSKISQIHCEEIEPVGIGHALMDRLKRAAKSSK